MAIQTQDYSQIARRITVTLFVAQSLSSSAFIVSGTVNAIVGSELSGNPAWAGVPAGVLQLAAAFAALAVGAAMDRAGRRGGIALGLTLGVMGTGLATFAIQTGSFLLFLGGSAGFGVARAAMQLGRFTAAEVHPPEQRGRAISYVVLGGTVGSVAGPLLVGPTSRWALRAEMNELAGPYVAALITLALATLAIYFWLRPDPREVGREIADLFPETVQHQGPTRSISQIMRTPAAIVAVSAMLVGQAVMVLLMGITSLHMKDHHHGLSNISMVISAHTFGMFAFSIISGRLTDRWGRGPVILIGSGMLVLACAFAPLSPDVLPLSLALFLLGLGWNFCYVAGSTLLADQLSPAERAKTQGTNDLLIGLSTAGVSVSSGLLFASIGYDGMGIVGAIASLALVGLVGGWMIKRRRLATAWS